MKKIIFFLFFLVMTNVKLYTRPIGFANCGNTCFQNAALQIIYQIDPLISIFSISQNLCVKGTLGYTFQHFIWDIIDAQKNNKSVIECGFPDNPTNLKKLTEQLYMCMGLGVGNQGDLFESFSIFMEELINEKNYFEKKYYEELVSFVSVSREETLYPSGSEPYTNPKSVEIKPYILLTYFSGPKELEKYINISISFTRTIKKWHDPRVKKEYNSVDVKYKFISPPKFILVAYCTYSGGRRDFSVVKDTHFPDELNLAQHIKGYSQALYQLRGIGVNIPGAYYFAVVRDRDEKLYICNDSLIQQVNSWQEGIGSYEPAVFLYLLKTAKQEFSDLDDFLNKLKKLQQSLYNLNQILLS